MAAFVEANGVRATLPSRLEQFPALRPAVQVFKSSRAARVSLWAIQKAALLAISTGLFRRLAKQNRCSRMHIRINVGGGLDLACCY